jgi:hypothetical protein
LALVAKSGDWTGTAAALLKVLTDAAEENVRRNPGWPKTPRALRGALTRIAPNLRRAGVSIEFLPRSGRHRLIAIRTSTENEGTRASLPSQPSFTAENRSISGDGASDGSGLREQTVVPTVTKNLNVGAACDGGDGCDDVTVAFSGPDEERF